MAQRRRYATIDELVSLITEWINVNTGETIDERSVRAVFDALEEHDVQPESLIKVSVVEPDPTVP